VFTEFIQFIPVPICLLPNDNLQHKQYSSYLASFPTPPPHLGTRLSSYHTSLCTRIMQYCYGFSSFPAGSHKWKELLLYQQFCRTKAVKQNFSFNITCWMDFWVMSMSWTADLSVIWAWCQDVAKFGVCPRYLPDWALVTEWRGRGRGKKRRGRRRREGRRKGTRWRRTRRSNCIKKWFNKC